MFMYRYKCMLYTCMVYLWRISILMISHMTLKWKQKRLDLVNFLPGIPFPHQRCPKLTKNESFSLEDKLCRFLSRQKTWVSLERRFASNCEGRVFFCKLWEYKYTGSCDVSVMCSQVSLETSLNSIILICYTTMYPVCVALNGQIVIFSLQVGDI